MAIKNNMGSMEKMLAIADKLNIAKDDIDTCCGHKSYIIHESDDRHIIIIPSDVQYLRDKETQTDLKFIQLRGRVRVMGGAGLKSTNNLFNGCKNLRYIDLNDLDTQNVTEMSHMFDGCKLLSDLDISNLVTNKVTDMSFMFNGCQSLLSLDLSGMDTSNVEDMSYMFNFCVSLKSLNLRNMDTRQVTDMSYMFNYCNSIESLDLRSFCTRRDIQAYDFIGMCFSLNRLYASKRCISLMRSIEDKSGSFPFGYRDQSVNFIRNLAVIMESGKIYRPFLDRTSWMAFKAALLFEK